MYVHLCRILYCGRKLLVRKPAPSSGSSWKTRWRVIRLSPVWHAALPPCPWNSRENSTPATSSKTNHWTYVLSIGPCPTAAMFCLRTVGLFQCSQNTPTWNLFKLEEEFLSHLVPQTWSYLWQHTVLAEINAHPRNKRPPKTVMFQRGEYTKPMGCDGWFFKGGSTQNRWVVMGDFSKGEYTKPMGCDGFWNLFFIGSKN